MITAMARMGCAVLAVIALSAGSAAAQPMSTEDGVEYVSLGDSFAAGSGVLPAAPGSDPRCARSDLNFPRIVAAARQYQLTDVTCARADTAAFTTGMFPDSAPQYDALSPSTDLVTVMIGGNDNNNFRDLTSLCVSAYLSRPMSSAPCTDELAAAPPQIEGILPNVVSALEGVYDRAPRARVFIVGYPWLVPETGTCFPDLPIASGDLPTIRDIQRRLNDTIRQAADMTGTTFVDMSQVSDGHDACSGPEQRWVEPIFHFQEFSVLHPNAAGEQAIAHQVLAAIGS